MAKNDRCPLQAECGNKCSYQWHELDCPYYNGNARPGYEIQDQEEKRWNQYPQAEEGSYWEDPDDEDEDEDDDEEEPKENDNVSARRLTTTSEVTYLDGPMGVTEKIKQAMYDAAKQFVYIGFLLWEVQQYGYYKEHGYQSVYEYAETELGFKRSSTKNFIAINQEFGYRKTNNVWESGDHRTTSIQQKYKDFNYSQLCEMLSMTPAKRETITPNMTIKQIREIKRQPEQDLPPNMKTIPIPMPEDKQSGQTSGQTIIILKLNKEQEKYIRYLLNEEISITPENHKDYKLATEILKQME